MRDSPHVDLWHNILWSRYKGAVFSEVCRQAPQYGLTVSVIHIAETETSRRGLSSIDRSIHDYPHEVLFQGSIDALNPLLLMSRLFWRVLRSESQVVLIPGFGCAEYWAMLLAAVLTRRRIGLFCDSTTRDKRRHYMTESFKRLFVALCDFYFCYGIRSREYLVALGAPSARIHLRCQAAALPPDYAPSDICTQRVASSRAAGLPHFIFVGRLSREKGLDLLFLAFQVVVNKHKGARLSIFGSGDMGSSLRQLARQLSLTDKIVFAGGRESQQLALEYLNATCLILPSSSEPWGLVVNEALHYGCPAIVSDVCGCVPELIVEGKTGFTFISGDHQDLANKMLLACDVFTDIEEVARNCVQQVTKYTPVRAARQILEGCSRQMRRGFVTDPG